ncbi:MAG TPA: hypothetical protein VHF05_02780 [Candidatus Paceibacterota bacterium]|nr:hypothetical protein [Candidatus Paceibacterota bacterium]
MARWGMAGAFMTLALLFASAFTVHAQTTTDQNASTTNTGTINTTTGTGVGLPNTGAGGFSGANIAVILVSAAAIAYGIRLASRHYSYE